MSPRDPSSLAAAAALGGGALIIALLALLPGGSHLELTWLALLEVPIVVLAGFFAYRWLRPRKRRTKGQPREF